SPASTRDFYESLPVFREFAQVADETCFRPVPGDGSIGVPDVQQSTRAIRENRYKAVNMAGAAVIASIANALRGRDFPCVFGGDRASCAVPPGDAALAREVALCPREMPPAPARRWRRRRPASRKTSISVCGSEWLRSQTFARRAA